MKTTMSEKPTSEADELELGQALAAGWSPQDYAWELCQEKAAAAAYDGDLDHALPLWRESLSLARAHFARDDPRLGTSLANMAFALRETGRHEAAAPLFEEARQVWDASFAWIEALRLERRARSSLFHLRMESLHRDKYEAHFRERLRRFAAEARSAVAKMAEGGRQPERCLPRWRSEKPPSFWDSRKLLAACLLLASRPPVERSDGA
jgi:tetratricopeptide (TPR) repeat protein